MNENYAMGKSARIPSYTTQRKKFCYLKYLLIQMNILSIELQCYNVISS